MKDKFLFCLFDGLRRDIVRQDTMPNIKKLTLGGMNMKKNMLRLEEDGLNFQHQIMEKNTERF